MAKRSNQQNNDNYHHPQTILLPKNGTDYSKYAVLACDQYAAQPDYWERVKNYVGDAPSTLHMTLPEAWLNWASPSPPS